MRRCWCEANKGEVQCKCELHGVVLENRAGENGGSITAVVRGHCSVAIRAIALWCPLAGRWMWDERSSVQGHPCTSRPDLNGISLAESTRVTYFTPVTFEPRDSSSNQPSTVVVSRHCSRETYCHRRERHTRRRLCSSQNLIGLFVSWAGGNMPMEMADLSDFCATQVIFQ